MEDCQKIHPGNGTSTDKREVDGNVVSPNTTGILLEGLNEDCLLQIFSSNSLTPMDLLSLAESCTRFKQITQRVFPKDYEIVLECNGPDEYQFLYENGSFHLDLQDVGRILKNFGSHLSGLSINRDDRNFMNLVGKHCGDATLNRLEISGLNSTEGVTTHMNSIHQRLQQLTVSDCHFLGNVKSEELNFGSLVDLKISRSSGCAVILKHNFPILKRFFWLDFDKRNNVSHLYEFIRRHGHLKIIEVIDVSVCRNALLHVIDSTCKELEELILKYVTVSPLYIDFSAQGSLLKLKILDLEFGDDTWTKNITFLQVMKSLETMRIQTMGEVPLQIFDILSQLQNLRELHLTFCPINRVPWKMLTHLRTVHLAGNNGLNSADFLNMIRQLTNLQELNFFRNSMLDSYFDCYFDLSKDDFARIIKIVERREHVLTLKCDFDFKLEENCNDNQKVKLIKYC